MLAFIRSKELRDNLSYKRENRLVNQSIALIVLIQQDYHTHIKTKREKSLPSLHMILKEYFSEYSAKLHYDRFVKSMECFKENPGLSGVKFSHMEIESYSDNTVCHNLEESRKVNEKVFLHIEDI